MRLTGAARAGRAIAFTFDGRSVPAIEGETVAAALSAAEIVAFRTTPGGAPRGLHCGMGACFDCVVAIDGRIGQRACIIRAADGMKVRGHAASGLALDPMPDGPPEERTPDVLIIGAGPAGLAAAVAAGEAGASVVVLDERSDPGGQYYKPLAPSHDGVGDAQHQAGRALLRRAVACARIETGASVWGAFAADEIAALVDGRSVIYRPRRLVLATGAHERPTPLPGWTLPGVMTTGALQGLVRAHRVVPGRRIVIAGSGPLNLQLACELLAGGVTVAAVIEAAPRPGMRSARDAWTMLRASPSLARDGLRYLLRLRRAGVPVLWDATVSRLDGEARVQSVVAGALRIEADTVAINFGFQPETGIARALRLDHRFVSAGLGHLATVTDSDGRSSDPAVFAVGDGAALGGARVALARGRLAGLAAARDLGFAAPGDIATRAALRRAEAFQSALWRVFPPPPFDPATLADATVVCRCEEVTAGRLRAEIAGGLGSVAALKKATRAGMGLCQGRFCAATIALLCPDPPDSAAFAAPRAPLRPVPCVALMHEAPEFAASMHRLPEPPPHRRSAVGTEAATCDVLVIGGGIIGLAVAYYLARDGVDVLVADRDEPGMAASTANAGSLHVQLLSYDFAAGTPDDAPAIAALPLGPASIALWHEIAAAAGEGLGLRTEGGLMLAADPAGLAWLHEKAACEARAGIETHVVGAGELRDLAPAIADGMLGAVFCPAEGYGDPLRGTAALLRLAGARVLREAEVSSIAREGSGWRVTTGGGTIAAGRIVNAAGPWAGRIAAMVGLDLPVDGTVQQVIVTEPGPPLLRHLVALAHRHLSLKQQANGSLLVGGGWPGGFEDGHTLNLRRSIEGNLWVAGSVLPALRGLSMARAWTGLAPSIDAAPIVGEALPGFFNAVAANGYTLGPIVARMTADAVRGAAPDPAFTLARFRRRLAA